MDINKEIEKFLKNGGNKTITNLAIVFLLGVLLVIGYNFFKGTSSSATVLTKDTSKREIQDNSDRNASEYEVSLQNKLKNTLERIEGVGRVELMIYFESSEEQVPAVNLNDATNLTEEKDTTGGVRNSTQKNQGSNVVITNDGSKNEPLIVKKYKPKITGVCIVAEGAEDKITELRITKAVINLFNLSQNKVNVYPMKK